MEIRLDGVAGHDHHAHARARLRAGRRLLPHRGPPERRAGHRRPLLRDRLGGRRPASTSSPSTPVASPPCPQPRVSLTTSSCGLCGTAGLEQLQQRLEPARRPGHVRARRPGQGPRPGGWASRACSAATGGVHGAAAFDTTGTPLVTREDIGRHNAVDKVVGPPPPRRCPARRRPRAVRQRPGQLRDRAEGVGRGLRARRGRRRAIVPGHRHRQGRRLALVGFARQDRLNLYAPA